jgi:hypothetical protein
MTVKLKLFADDAAIAKEIKAIKVAGLKLQDRIHVCAVSILKRWKETGDRRPMLQNINDLLTAMPDMTRKNAFKAWVEMHFQLTAEKAGFVWQEGHRFTPSDEQVKAAADEPFWQLVPEPEYKAVDFNALIKKLVKAAEKDLEKTGEQSSVDLDKLAAIKALIEG